MRGAREAGEFFADFSRALRRKAWNPIPRRLSAALSTSDVDKGASASVSHRAAAKDASPSRTRAARDPAGRGEANGAASTVRAGGVREAPALGYFFANLARALRYKA
ncbi:hypothetical protein [Lysobacter firmicutimachus]|uniref:Uncharacterized protein n=1 Tax=Lysobacter firmicutimachus TaxID=1792846 RepID=A0ABU8D048_9GAMM